MSVVWDTQKHTRTKSRESVRHTLVSVGYVHFRLWKMEAYWQCLCRKWSIFSSIVSCRMHGLVPLEVKLRGNCRLVRRVFFAYECKWFAVSSCDRRGITLRTWSYLYCVSGVDSAGHTVDNHRFSVYLLSRCLCFEVNFLTLCTSLKFIVANLSTFMQLCRILIASFDTIRVIVMIV